MIGQYLSSKYGTDCILLKRWSASLVLFARLEIHVVKKNFFKQFNFCKFLAPNAALTNSKQESQVSKLCHDIDWDLDEDERAGAAMVFNAYQLFKESRVMPSYLEDLTHGSRMGTGRDEQDKKLIRKQNKEDDSD